MENGFDKASELNYTLELIWNSDCTLHFPACILHYCCHIK